MKLDYGFRDLGGEGDGMALPQAAADQTTQQGWYQALPVVGISLLLLIALYWETALSLAEIWWSSDTYAHGMLVIPIAFYMCWVRRQTLMSLPPRSSLLGLGLLLWLCLGWLVAHAANVLIIQQMALVAMIPALVYALLGPQVTWNLAFPLAFVFFAVPVGEDLVPPLMDFTALFTVEALQLTGIPVFWEGYYITIPTGNFVVAEACSGIRYLIASVALGCLYAYLMYHSLWRRAAFIGLAILFPILANGVRAYGIVMLAHLSDMRLATGVDHIIYGWIFFGVVMLLLFWIGSWWSQPEKAVKASSSVMESETTTAPQAGKSRWLAIAAASSLILSSGPLGAAWLEAGSDSLTPVSLQAPQAPTPWTEVQVDDWKPNFRGASDILQQSYRLDGRTVHLYIAYYRQQVQGAELINSQNILYDDQRWYPIGKGVQTIPLDQEELHLSETRISSPNRKRLIWHWYQVGQHTTTSSLVTKLLEAWDQLSGARQGSALVAVAADYEIQPAEAENLLARFLETMQPRIQSVLER